MRFCDSLFVGFKLPLQRHASRFLKLRKRPTPICNGLAGTQTDRLTQEELLDPHGEGDVRSAGVLDFR